MSNPNNPNGFQYLTMNRGFPPRTRIYNKLASLGTAIFQHDVCHQVAGVSANDMAPVEPLGTGTPGTSILLGVSAHYSAASTLARMHIYVDQDAEYVAQDNNATDGITGGNMGLNGNVDPTAGSTVTGWSKHQINETGLATSSALDLHLLRRFPDPNNAFGPNCRIICKLNKNREAMNTAGV